MLQCKEQSRPDQHNQKYDRQEQYGSGDQDYCRGFARGGAVYLTNTDNRQSYESDESNQRT